ncbi:MAG: bifunctional folylpolyglutamate synthase/dihydrofolate synthase [Acidobacteria bacterium]|nr:bifunctional folylpolyglutamate synthase/dihydrofolate synthase [Acidobacteriota bacterium]
MDYQETVRYLLALGGEVKGAKLGLDRIETLLERLGRPERAFRSVHIAGTNGKGSTAAMVEAGLRAAGFRTGLYTSPHLVRINERVQVAGREIPDSDFAAAFEPVRAATEQLLAEGALEAHPTFFECVTALAFSHFRSAGVEHAVVEVGLGGRLDATNVVQPVVAAITPVDLDHEAWLGKTAATIAGEKAGILKQGVPAVFAPQSAEVREVLEAQARELGIPVVRAGVDWRAENIRHHDGYYRFEALSYTGRELSVELSLAGEHQVTNALVAIAVLDLVGLTGKAIEQGLRQARWPGRLEKAAESPDILLDGAHNPAGARALARYLEQHQRGRRIWLIYAAMRDKAVDEVAGILFPAAHRVFLTRVAMPRALHPQALVSLVAHHHPQQQVSESLAEALAAARGSAKKEDIILVTGSLFLVGEARALLGLCSGP